MKVAIIIINYNKYEKTIECIDSIQKSKYKDYQIYLLDNASTNNSYEILHDRYKGVDKIQLIKSEKNLGYANGNNLCIEKAKKDGYRYAIISNNDIIYNLNTIGELVKKIEKSDYFIIGPKVVLPNGNTQDSNKLERPTFLHYLLHETYFNNFLKKDKNIETQKEKEVYWIAGCCFIVDLVKFQEIGYFDKNTFLYYEEYIISEKSKKANYKILYNPNVEVLHHHGASTGDVNVNIYLEHFKSEMYFWKKYRNINKCKMYILYFIRNFEIKFSLKKRKREEEYRNFKKISKEVLKHHLYLTK